ncbi:MAG: TRAP transporter small permease [Pseudomonadota bacterium]
MRRVNRAVALGIGFGLLALVALIITDITLRALGRSLGGTDEISGYAMALLTAWGMGYALLEGAHVRIEALRERAPNRVRSAMDLLALASLTLVVNVVLWRAWPVFSRSWLNDSHANTPLETPLWAVQLPWLLGWAWFALSAWVMLALMCVHLARQGSTQQGIP